MIDIWTVISVDLYMNLTNDKNIPINDDTQKVKEYLFNQISEMNKDPKTDTKKKEILKKICILKIFFSFHIFHILFFCN